MRHRFSPRPLVPLALLLVTLSGCAASTAPASEPSRDTHGEIAGAAELGEPALGLTSMDEEGRVSHLDLLDETTVDLGTVRAPTALHSDGRYLFSIDDAGVSIVDSGVWTWDHVDHFHYYRAEARILGDVSGGDVSGGDVSGGSGSGGAVSGGAPAGENIATVATSNSSTTGGTGLYFPGSGEAVLLDTEALSKGEVTETFRLTVDPGPGLVVPAGSFAAVAAGDEVTLHAADGVRTGDPVACPSPAGTITTRVGAVIGCQDGALLITVEDERPVVERIPYPAGSTAPRATAFANREGRPTVAGVADGVGVWLLDTRERAWTLLPTTQPVLQAVAVDDKDANVLALAADGSVRVLDGETGAERAASVPLVAASLAAGLPVNLVADQQRAYLNGLAENRLWELDFADGARVAREFTPERAPRFFAETGR